MDIGLILFLFSSVFVLLGAYFWQKGNRLITRGKKADAIIVGNNFKAYESVGERTYYPVVRFLTDKNETIIQELSTGSSIARPEGTNVVVIYDPEEPTVVEINATFQLEVLPRVFVALGVAGIVLGTLEYLNIINFASK